MISNINPYRKKKSKYTKPTMLRRTPQQMEHDRSFIAKYYLRGYSYRDIAKFINEELTKLEAGYALTEASVYNDIKIIQIEWKRERFETIEEYMQMELRKLDKIETELWEAWEASKRGKRRIKIRGGQLTDKDGEGAGGTLQNRIAESSAGDPKFLDLLLEVQNRRAKLLGYDIPVKPQFDKPVEVPNTGYVDFSKMPIGVLSQLADLIQDQNADFERRRTIDTSEGYVDYESVKQTIPVSVQTTVVSEQLEEEVPEDEMDF